MKILVTGGAGFIGSNFCDYVRKNYPEIQIEAVDNLSTGKKEYLNNDIKLHIQSVRSFAYSKPDIEEYDAIFFFAALPRIQPSYSLITEHIDNNVTQALYLIQNIIKKEAWNTKFIYSGSSAIYGNPSIFPTPESCPPSPLSPYAKQKLDVEQYLELLSVRYPLQWVSLRYFNPYGPRSYNPDNKFSAYSSVVGIFEWRRKNDLSLLVTGDGLQRRDFVNVSDVAKANWLAFANYKRNTAYNVGTGITHSVLEVANMFGGNIEFIPKREGEAEITQADNKKIIEELGMEFLRLEEYQFFNH